MWGPTVGRDDEKLLTPGEVAELFGVDPKTVARWADAGRLDALRTLGGHRRYRAGDVRRLLERQTEGGTERGTSEDPDAAD